MSLKALLTLASAIFSGAVATGEQNNNCHERPPRLVDLGYAKHVPTFTNKTSSGHDVHIYKNIRFANAPTGNLRFRKPDTNLPVQHGVQDGKVPWTHTDCIATAPWQAPFPGINGTTWGHEDCLFLDVYVPDGLKPGDHVPVLQYFFGSGYAFGSKDIMFSPMGLFDQMFEEHKGKFIFVTNNYRLGIPGWSFSEDEDMDGNVGLLDCLAAAEWTKQYIHKFGGDGHRITAAGESAGGGILYYMSVVNDGKGKLPFNQAFISSPASAPHRDVAERQKRQFDLILKTANCKTMKCLRSVPEKTIRATNRILINETPAGGGGGNFGPEMGFSPMIDGKTILDTPLGVFSSSNGGKGRFHGELDRLMLGSMAYEGMYTSHDTDLEKWFPIMVRQIMPNASDETVQIIRDMYHPLAKPAQLAWDWTTDIVFACNIYNLGKVMGEKSKRYIMSTPPAVHGQDVYYFFYVDQKQTPIPKTDIPLARHFQSQLLRFVRGEDLPGWPTYGHEERMVNITSEFEKTRLPEKLKRRCEKLNSFVLDRKNGA